MRPMFKYLSIAEAQAGIEKSRFILVSLDLEFFEHENILATEYGLAIYSPTLQKNPYGTTGAESIWPGPIFPNIIAQHYIVEEHRRKLNGMYVADNKFNFNFGKSFLMSNPDCIMTINRILRSLGEKVVFVGHAVETDLNALIRGGLTWESPFRIIDTQKLWTRITHASFSSLERILGYCEIPHSRMHNGGNDAYYTLQLALSLADPGFRKMHRLETVIPTTPSSRKQFRRQNHDAPVHATPDQVLKALADRGAQS